jgi:hypothetical protein
MVWYRPVAGAAADLFEGVMCVFPFGGKLPQS